MISEDTWFIVRSTAYGGLILWLLILLVDSSTSSTRKKILERRRKFTLPKSQREFLDAHIPWEDQFARADSAIRELIETLPPEIRKEADRVPYVLEKWPPSGMPDSYLGLCFSFEPKMVSEAPGPLFIYIGPHHAFCARWKTNYTEEIRRTYLHELGHHLGLDEVDLHVRGIG